MEKKLNYITPDEIAFYNSEGGLLMARYKGEDIGRIAVLRMFPLQYDEEFLSVRPQNYDRFDKESETGIIRNLKDFPDDAKGLVRAELERRYFVPDIIAVKEVKEQIGHILWKVTTNKGDREFTLTDMSVNITNLGGGQILLTDVYGNRYRIADITKLDDKTMRVIEIWI